MLILSVPFVCVMMWMVAFGSWSPLRRTNSGLALISVLFRPLVMCRHQNSRRNSVLVLQVCKNVSFSALLSSPFLLWSASNHTSLHLHGRPTGLLSHSRQLYENVMAINSSARRAFKHRSQHDAGAVFQGI
jgi:hypothetical protein